MIIPPAVIEELVTLGFRAALVNFNGLVFAVVARAAYTQSCALTNASDGSRRRQTHTMRTCFHRWALSANSSRLNLECIGS